MRNACSVSHDATLALRLHSMQKPTKRSLAVVTVAALALCTIGFAASQTCANTNQKTSTRCSFALPLLSLS